jgi:DNA-binding transcriptional LysR family regulator
MTARPSLDLLDGHLLRVLCVLLEERSVSRAARKLDATQPSISTALKRLRDIFADPLLVRDKLDMVPTARALQLEAPARAARDAMAQLVETHLATLRAQREARVSVPYFAFAPHVVAETDLVFTTARHFAEPYTHTLPVVMLAAPPGFPSMRFYQLWHERAHHASAHRWLRGVIGDVGRALAPRRTKAATG